MFLYSVFDDHGNYLGKVEHDRELKSSEHVGQNALGYRINYIGGGGKTLRVAEAAGTAWEAEIIPPSF